MSTVALRSTEGRWIMVSAILASSMAFIDGTALNVVLPSLQRSLHASGAELFWILNAYLLMLAALILIGGALGDKLGRKKVFMTGILIFISGSVACGFASTAGMLIACRLLQGVGGAMMIPGSLSLISSSIHDSERGKAIGTWSAVTTLVTMGGPVLGGALADAGHWRYIFFINVPIGLAAVFFLWKYVTERKDTDSPPGLDFTGALLIALGLAALTFGFLRMPALGFHHSQVWGTILGGVLLLAAFVMVERRSPHPMMPLHLFANPVFTGTNLLTLFLYAGLGAGMLFLSLNMVQVQGYSQLQSGLTFLPFTVLMILIARYAGTLADRYGAKPFLVGGPLVAGTGMLLLSMVKQTKGPSEYWTTFFPGVLVLGLGMSFTVAPLTAAVMGAVSDHLSGIASGVNNAISRIAGVFANAVFGALAVLLFTSALQNELQSLPLTPPQQEAVMQQATDLGNAAVPPGIDNKASVIKAYHNSFISAYHKILALSGGLAFLGTLMALIFIRPSR